MRKFKKPTWASDNNIKVMCDWGLGSEAAAKRVKDNNRIARALKRLGWKFREGVGIADIGGSYYQLTFIKKVRGVKWNKKNRPHKHPYVYFAFRWDNQGGEDFMVGEMHTFYNYAPNEYTMRPGAVFEIKYITEKHLPLMNKMFNGLVAALNSQNPSYGSR
jgi:hypothetical protein